MVFWVFFFLSFRDITTMKGTIVAQVDSSESFQEFCSTSCLSFYEDKQNPSKGVLNKSRCTICGKLTEVWLTVFSFIFLNNDSINNFYSAIRGLKIRKFKIWFSIFICSEILRYAGLIFMKSNWRKKEFKEVNIWVLFQKLEVHFADILLLLTIILLDVQSCNYNPDFSHRRIPIEKTQDLLYYLLFYCKFWKIMQMFLEIRRKYVILNSHECINLLLMPFLGPA